MSNAWVRECLDATGRKTLFRKQSAFYVEALAKEPLMAAVYEVAKLGNVMNSFQWNEREQLGIDEVAWSYIIARGIEPHSVFLHPRLLREQPQLLIYYSAIALVPVDDLSQTLGRSIDSMERDGVEHLPANAIAEITVAINEAICAALRSFLGQQDAFILGFRHAIAASRLQSFWNDATVAEGSATVNAMLTNLLRNEIEQLVWKNGKSTAYSQENHAEILDQIADVRVVRMKNGFHLLFANEPDVSLRDKEDRPVLAMEVKAGHDTAGALERLGASMKSFDNDRSINPRVKTVYVVRAMTPELESRIRHGSPFDYTFGLSELLADGKAQARFANLVLRTALGK